MTQTKSVKSGATVRGPGRPFASFEGGSLQRDVAVSSALEIVAEKGLDGLTIQALAKSLNMSRAPIYVLFSSRQALVEAVVDIVLSKIFLEDITEYDDWRDTSRQLALRAFNIYTTYPGTSSHMSRMGFPRTPNGHKSARLLSNLMRKAGASDQLIPTLIFAHTSMIAGADLELSGQRDRDKQSAELGKGRESLAHRHDKALSVRAVDMAMFLEANELLLLGIEALINKRAEQK